MLSMVENVLGKVNNMMSKIKAWLKKNVALGATIVFAIFTLVLWLFSVETIDFSDLWLNLLAGFISTICTITVIDSTLKKQKEKEDIPIRLALYRDVQLLTSRFIGLWQEMYAQCNVNRKRILVEDLFSDEEIGYIYKNLDLEGSPSTVPQRNWFVYIEENIKDFKTRGNCILDRYVSIAEPDILQAIHQLINDNTLCAHLLLIHNIRRNDVCEQIPRAPLLFSYACKPNEQDFQSIKIIIKWCRDNYVKLNDYGTIYTIPEKVVILNQHIPPSSIIDKEKLENYLIRYQKKQEKKC